MDKSSSKNRLHRRKNRRTNLTKSFVRPVFTSDDLFVSFWCENGNWIQGSAIPVSSSEIQGQPTLSPTKFVKMPVHVVLLIFPGDKNELVSTHKTNDMPLIFSLFRISVQTFRVYTSPSTSLLHVYDNSYITIHFHRVQTIVRLSYGVSSYHLKGLCHEFLASL